MNITNYKFNQYQRIDETELDEEILGDILKKRLVTQKEEGYSFEDYCGTMNTGKGRITIVPAYNTNLATMMEYLERKQCQCLKATLKPHEEYPKMYKISNVFESYARCILCSMPAQSCPLKEKKRAFDTDKNLYIQQSKGANLEADIVIKNESESIVVDVKFKDGLKKHNIREDRLQILAYALKWNCKIVGHIFPSSNSNLSINITTINRKDENKSHKDEHYYVQVFLPTDEVDDTWKDTIIDHLFNPGKHYK